MAKIALRGTMLGAVVLVLSHAPVHELKLVGTSPAGAVDTDVYRRAK